MSARQQSRGSCTYCGREMAKRGMARHLASCPQRKETIAAADKKPRRKATLYHLRVQDGWQGVFWLDLEMSGARTLEDLDGYLRSIWLECCGHLSRFSVGGWRGQEIDMSSRIDRVFQPDVALTHIYDFGTSSITTIKAVATREGKPTTKHPIVLMARNAPPQETCIECGKPAAWLCVECTYEAEVWGTLCDLHAKIHPHGDYGEPIPLVNSPRVGMCGYVGPAEPPY